MDHSFDHTVWRFLLFLLAEVAFVIASLLVMMLLGLLVLRKQEVKNSYVMLYSLGTTILVTVFLIVFTWALTGQGHVLLFSVILAVSIALYLIVELVCLIFGGGSTHWLGRVLWTNFEFERMNPALNSALQIGFAIILFIVYPVYIGIGYFGDSGSPDEWTRDVIRATLIVLIGTAWVVQLPKLIYMLVSRNILEKTRSRIFIARLGDSAALLVFLSVFIWTIDGAGTTKTVFGEYFVFSSTMGYIIGAYVVGALVLPYLVGHYRSKYWVDELQRERFDLIDALTNGLESLSVDNAVSELDQSRERIQGVLDELYEQPAMALAIEIANSDEPQLMAPRLGLEKSLKVDPRFVHVDHLERLLELIDECKEVVAEKDDEKSKKEVLKACVARVGKERKKDIGAAGTTKAWILIAISSLATSIANPIISAVGKYITEQLPF